MSKLVRVVGHSGKSLDLPEEVVEQFRGREHDLRVHVDAHVDFFTSERAEITDAMWVLAGTNVARADLNKRKGKKPDDDLRAEALAYAIRRLPDFDNNKTRAASAAVKKYGVSFDTIRDKLKKVRAE